MLKAILVFLISFLILGCSQRLIDFSLISSKNVDLSRAAEFVSDKQRVNGEDTKYIIIFIPTGIPNAKEALDKAIESVPGAIALLDGVLTYHWFYIPYIFGKSTYTVTGTALIDPSLRADFRVRLPKYSSITLDKNGNVAANQSITENEYFLFANK